MKRSLFLALAAVLMPLGAGANYLYEVLPPEVQPYVLLVVDNSGSMNAMDPVTRTINGQSVRTGLYADEDQVCIPNEGWNSCKTTATQCCFGNTCTTVSSCSDKKSGNCAGGTCKTNVPLCDCPTRLTTAQDVLKDLIPGLDNMRLGLVKYGAGKNVGCTESKTGLCKLGCSSSYGKVIDPLPDSLQSNVLQSIAAMVYDGSTPIVASIELAAEHIQEVARLDDAHACRPYYVILVTDGEESCKKDGLATSVEALRKLQVGSGATTATIDVRTFVLGFGPDVASPDKIATSDLSKMARAGGTAEVDGEICSPLPGEPCPTGVALFANDRKELATKLRTAFQKITEGEFAAQAPVIGTVPLESTEIGRVSRNFMAYSAFRKPGYSGHLYGIRLFQEDSETRGVWEFTDLTRLNLDRCGESGNPCLYDAGKLLETRVKSNGKARTIFTGAASEVVKDGAGGLTLRFTESDSRIDLPRSSAGTENLAKAWGSYVADVGVSAALADPPPNLSQAMQERLLALNGSGGAEDRNRILDWLHGTSRPWPLADMYHSGSSVIGAPAYNYRTRGYSNFKAALRNRPDMVYVGANDGMIHAFHAGPDLTHKAEGFDSPRWIAGEEAWAYLPTNMLARASSAILALPENEPRFVSQDLSCRFDDVLTIDNHTKDDKLDCGDDPYCGWRTVMLCGQGWGGSWYVAMDVSDPLKPNPLWESTYDGIADEQGMGLGKTWSVPSVAVLNFAESTAADARTLPTWVAVYGSGYNADMKDSSDKSYPAYRRLNLPFDGGYAYHGNGDDTDNTHVFLQNMADGSYLKVFHHHALRSVVANIPLLDLDGDGFTDVAYVGGWSGQLDRIAFVKSEASGEEPAPLPLRTHPDNWGSNENLFTFGSNQPFTSSPTVMVDPLLHNRVYLFASGGVDNGSFPDQQSASKEFGFKAFSFEDDGSKGGPQDGAGFPDAPNLCTSKENGGVGLADILNSNVRLLGSPQLSVNGTISRWLSFTAWNPDTTACAEGTASLHCLEVGGVGRCLPCGDLGSDATEDGSTTEIDTGGRKPPPPSAADGQLYFVGADGPVRVNNQDGQSGGVADSPPNVNAPRSVVISWREIFES